MSDLAWMRPLLADLCGLPGRETAHFCNLLHWRPDEDVTQAIRVLEALPGYCCKSIRLPVGEPPEVALHRELSSHDRASVLESGDTIPYAICLAIAAALNWQEPKPGDQP